MKIIISHDIDHLSALEHYNDTIIPKLLVRSQIEFFKGIISSKELFNRINDIFKNKWQNIKELIDFNTSQNLNTTFFMGVNNGLGLAYPLSSSIEWINYIKSRNFEVGVHGINYTSLEEITIEFDRFHSNVENKSFGIRMHYLRINGQILENLSKAGYLYDCSTSEMRSPYKINQMWEFPLQLMDVWVMNANNRWQSRNLDQAKDYSKQIIEKAVNANLKYFTVLFHDRYFSNSFKTWKDWYVWFIEWCKKNGFEFVNYRSAIRELEGK